MATRRHTPSPDHPKNDLMFPSCPEQRLNVVDPCTVLHGMDDNVDLDVTSPIMSPHTSLYVHPTHRAIPDTYVFQTPPVNADNEFLEMAAFPQDNSHQSMLEYCDIHHQVSREDALRLQAHVGFRPIPSEENRTVSLLLPDMDDDYHDDFIDKCQRIASRITQSHPRKQAATRISH